MVVCGVCAATLASLLGVAVDLALVAGFRRQRVIIHFSFLFRTARVAAKAQTSDAVPVRPRQTRSPSGNLHGQLPRGRFTDVPSAGAEVPGRTAAEVTPICVGAAELAGVLAGGALVDV